VQNTVPLSEEEMNSREAIELDRYLTKSDEDYLPEENKLLSILCDVQLFAGQLIAEGEQHDDETSIYDGQVLLGLLDSVKDQLEKYRG
jgi:hypothetical protein